MLRLIQLLVIIYIVLVIYHLLELQKYNKNGYVYHTNNTNELSNNISQLNPILYHSEFVNDSFDTTQKENPDHQIKNGSHMFRLQEYPTKQSIYVFKDKDICRDLNLDKSFDYSIQDIPNYRTLFLPNVSISIFKGTHSVPLQKCNHNYNMIELVKGESIIYLFNPKHKEDIQHKENNQIKKWGHKIKLLPKMTLFIPTNWFYIQEIEEETVQYHIDIDSVFTFIPNFLRTR